MSDQEKQEEFETRVKRTNSIFPKGTPLVDHWDESQKYIEQVRALAQNFQEHSKDPHPTHTLPELGELLKKSFWYIYEVGRLDDALQLLEIAFETVPDKESALYAHLCNSAACIYYEQNNLKSCQEFNEMSLRIREKILAPDDLDLVNSYHNLGSLALAQGQYDKALEFYAKTEKTRLEAGKEAVIYLGLTHLMIGRVHFLCEEYPEASKRYDMAEEVFKINPGPVSQPMAHLMYAFGNIEYAKANFTIAKELYGKGHQISNDLGPKHVLTATFDYKLAVVEAKLGNYDEAMIRLQKALAIVEMHKARGDIARILRRQAVVIREDPRSTPAQAKEADKLMEEAEAIRTAISDPDQDDSLPVDLVYDNLVCGYYR